MKIYIFVLAACVLAAQTPVRRKPAPAVAPNRDSWPIASITIEGNHAFSNDQILKVAELKLGQTADKKLLEAAHERLMASGAFDSVAYRYEPASKAAGIALTFELVEVNALYPVMFEGLPAKDSDIRAYIQTHDPLFGDKVSATKEALAHYEKLVSEYLAAQNFHEPLVATLSVERPPDPVILIRPATPRPTIAEVHAVNTGEIPAGVVQSTAYGVALGTIYSEPRFRQILDESIRPLYEARGHLRVAFPKVETAPAKDVKGVAVTVAVEEGPVFRFGRIRVSGADTARLELPAVLKIKTGDLADFDAVKSAQTRIEEQFRHDGFLRVDTQVLRDVHDGDKTVDVNIRIISGPLFTFRTLKIIGLDIETEPVVRRMWGLKEGAAFRPDYPQHFLNRVKEDGLFDNLKITDSARKIDYDQHAVDVTLYFNQKAPQ